jgi:hypothetical protein
MSLIRVILQAIRERRLPMFGWSRNGTLHSSCPRCRAPIMMSKIEAGKQAFTCSSCGESAVWKAEA